MNLRRAVLLVCVLLFGTVAYAQDTPKFEVPLDYSYMRFNPENSNIVSSFSLNGGGFGLAGYFAHWFGIEADLQFYGSTTKSFTFPAGVVAACPAGCTVTAQGNLFTYNVGPIAKFRAHKFEPFVEALFGGAHSNVFANLYKDCIGCVASRSPSNNAFDFIIGGGVDIPVNEHIAVRPVQVDYVLTRFGNAFTRGNQNQSNFRYIGGIVFRF
jgi:opacity protein-like surface antigen